MSGVLLVCQLLIPGSRAAWCIPRAPRLPALTRHMGWVLGQCTQGGEQLLWCQVWGAGGSGPVLTLPN